MLKAFDVLIVGGGPVGWACACASLSAAPKLRVGVVDRDGTPAQMEAANRPAVGSATGFERRVYTVTEANLAWIASLGVRLQEISMQAVERIRVFDQRGGNPLTINARESVRERLACVLGHDALTRALSQRAIELGAVSITGEVRSTGLNTTARYIELASGNLLQSKLVIVADGAQSSLRDQLGVQCFRRSYERTAAVAHFELGTPHRAEARQWFLPDRSILALLPLPEVNTRPAASMVWSTTAMHAESLQAMPSSELCEAVAVATGPAAEIASAITPVSVFPLELVRVADPVAARALIVGDAAHAIHPLAGQGVNLGLGDARAVAEALKRLGEVTGDPGHALLLAKFRRSRYAAVLALQAATDGLARIYNVDDTDFPFSATTAAAFGDLGMRVLGRLPAFRHFASSVAS